MSSQPDNAPRARKRVHFEQWRKVMLLGAFILLGNALAGAFTEGQPRRWASIALLFIGYGLLAVGFGIRMRALKQARAKAAETRDKERPFSGRASG